MNNNNPLVTFIATAYKESLQAYQFLVSLIQQTDIRWKCIVYLDHDNEEIKKIIQNLNDERISWVMSGKNTGFWGHYNRKNALNFLVNTEYIIQASIQDYYTPNTVADILKAYGTDFIYFDCIHNHRNYDVLITTPKACLIDWGTMAVKTDFAKKVGINHPESSICDGLFAEECMLKNPTVYKINKILLVHN